MSTPNLPKVESGMSVEQLANLVAILIKELTWLLTGHLDVKNIRAEGIETRNLKAGSVIAEKIDVAKLSAISADLGHITAGLIEAITIIGSLIQTATTGQRIELSSVDNLLKAVNTEGNTLSILPNVSGAPAIEFINGTAICNVFVSNNQFAIVSANSDVQITSTVGYLRLFSGKTVQVRDWNEFQNYNTGRTLQQELNEIRARLSALENRPPSP